ncbi:uncharacterized protein BXZ73DRAFT_74950 [Epithele typhae]|uniref:uncharacterized protein n=1 Tax=Epithele typhae TaxID=378194 RepID=UPI002008CD15|nr:uncharacterized protein BXZ73DRAFT_74950 [Epithele typhae]KAH9941769.1 hypothetical protein BXZ73DRAFT_74950 [Epithele typhae]
MALLQPPERPLSDRRKEDASTPRVPTPAHLLPSNPKTPCRLRQRRQRPPFPHISSYLRQDSTENCRLPLEQLSAWINSLIGSPPRMQKMHVPFYRRSALRGFSIWIKSALSMSPHVVVAPTLQYVPKPSTRTHKNFATSMPWSMAFDEMNHMKKKPKNPSKTLRKKRNAGEAVVVATPSEEQSFLLLDCGGAAPLNNEQHGGKVEHQCPLCPRKFTFAHSLALHMKWHWGASKLEWRRESLGKTHRPLKRRNIRPKRTKTSSYWTLRRCRLTTLSSWTSRSGIYATSL